MQNAPYPTTTTQERSADQELADEQRQAVRPEPAAEYGGLYPRWPLLAAAMLTPLVLLGYMLWLIFQSRACPFDLLCQLDRAPGPLQVALIWLVFGLLWMFSYAWGLSSGVHISSEGSTVGSFDDSAERGGALVRWARRATNFTALRGLVMSLGAVTLAAIIALFIRHAMTGATFALSTIVVFVALCHALYRDPMTRRPLDGQTQHERNLARGGSFVGVLSTIPPFRWVFLARATRAQPRSHPDH